jgi:hypothetical protein
MTSSQLISAGPIFLNISVSPFLLPKRLHDLHSLSLHPEYVDLHHLNLTILPITKAHVTEFLQHSSLITQEDGQPGFDFRQGQDFSLRHSDQLLSPHSFLSNAYRRSLPGDKADGTRSWWATPLQSQHNECIKLHLHFPPPPMWLLLSIYKSEISSVHIATPVYH